jgi:hypothetical protein
MTATARKFRKEVEARLRRIARAAEVFMDGDDFRQVAFDPDLGEVRTGEPDPQYYVDHARFVGLKRTLLRLRRLEPGPCSAAAWRPFRQGRADLERELAALDERVRKLSATVSPANRSGVEARLREFGAARERLQARIEGRLVEEPARVVILIDVHPVPARPGIRPAGPAMSAAFAGGTAAQEFELNGRPGLSVFAPIRDSLGDVVGAAEVYAPLVPEKRAGEFFGLPATTGIQDDEALSARKEGDL